VDISDNLFAKILAHASGL